MLLQLGSHPQDISQQRPHTNIPKSNGRRKEVKKQEGGKKTKQKIKKGKEDKGKGRRKVGREVKA